MFMNSAARRSRAQLNTVGNLLQMMFPVIGIVAAVAIPMLTDRHAIDLKSDRIDKFRPAYSQSDIDAFLGSEDRAGQGIYSQSDIDSFLGPEEPAIPHAL